MPASKFTGYQIPWPLTSPQIKAGIGITSPPNTPPLTPADTG